ncbi:MAG: efflux RND transporter periplasmic adaptor subunit [Planctomycetota bacterium]|jgi:RND family efflux transporter MFP subunit
MSDNRNARHPVFLVLVLGFTAVVILVGAMTLRTVNAREMAQRVADDSPAGTPVTVIAVERRIATMAAYFRGFLEPFLELTLSAEVPGEIVEQMVDISSEVNVADLLFKIDDAVLKIEHEQALAALDKATADFSRAQEHWDRIRGLEETHAAQTERVDTEAQFLSAKALMRQAEAAVRRATLLMERTAVQSPIKGVVSRIHSRRGEFIQAGQPLAGVIQVDRLKLLVELADREIMWVKEGHPAILTTSMFPLEQFEGRIHRIYPKALPTSRKFEVEIELPNPSRRLRPGFFMNGSLERPASETPEVDEKGVLVVPREAVVEQEGKNYCWVVRPAEGEPGDSEEAHVATRTQVIAVPASFDARILRILDGAREGYHALIQ